MKVAAFRNKETNFTADLWTFTEVTDATGNNNRAYQFNRTISFDAVTGQFGKLDVYFADTEDDVRIFAQLFNLKNVDGIELERKGVWQVDQVAPFINMWGHREGFKGRLAWFGVSS